MGLNVAKGNMYEWVTHTWNTIKGECPHGCSYCYMHRFPQKAVRFDERELRTDLGERNFIFVGSSCDMFAEKIKNSWISETLGKCRDFNNRYLFQSKDTDRLEVWASAIPSSSVICTTIETNRWYPKIMRFSRNTEERAHGMGRLSQFKRYVTIEPIIDFDLVPMVELIKRCDPEQVNIGADSGRNNLPEPTMDKVLKLVDELQKFTVIAKKRNLDRLIRSA